MSVIVTIKLVIDPAHVDELIDLFNERAFTTRAYPGCEVFEIYGDESAPGRMMIYQVWASRHHHERYFSSEPETEMFNAVEPYLLGPPEIRCLDELDA